MIAVLFVYFVCVAHGFACIVYRYCVVNHNSNIQHSHTIYYILSIFTANVQQFWWMLCVELRWVGVYCFVLFLCHVFFSLSSFALALFWFCLFFYIRLASLIVGVYFMLVINILHFYSKFIFHSAINREQADMLINYNGAHLSITNAFSAHSLSLLSHFFFSLSEPPPLSCLLFLKFPVYLSSLSHCQFISVSLQFTPLTCKYSFVVRVIFIPSVEQQWSVCKFQLNFITLINEIQ